MTPVEFRATMNFDQICSEYMTNLQLYSWCSVSLADKHSRVVWVEETGIGMVAH